MTPDKQDVYIDVNVVLEGDNSLGFVTTHDLELTHLSEDNDSIENYHFKDDVNRDELIFNYQIQDGPCPTTNALKIMAMEGLPVEYGH